MTGQSSEPTLQATKNQKTEVLESNVPKQVDSVSADSGLDIFEPETPGSRVPPSENPEARNIDPNQSNAFVQPRMLGRYKILEEVGRGSTAIVYRAYDPQLGRFLAVKLLRERLARDEAYREGFVREARLAAQLTHSNIVTIYDVGISNDKPYIAMELLEGATLEQILKRNNKLKLNIAIHIAIQLSAALSYAHKQGVVHRDIKPGNIVVLKDRKTIKLTDFGIAQIDENIAKPEHFNDKVVGTPEYMSPEQILGQKIDSRSDLYSLGALLYTMLAGFPPFISVELGYLFKQIIKSKQPEIYVYNDRVQDDINDLLRKLLQKKPSKRFQSAKLLLVELRHIFGKLKRDETKTKTHFSSLTTRWTITMASSVFVSMCVGLVVVYFMQLKAISGITYDYGHTIAKIIAYQSSEAIVLEDTLGLKVLVEESLKNEQLEVIYILNRNNLILASNLQQRVGEIFVAPDQERVFKNIGKAKIYQGDSKAEEMTFNVGMPINFGDKLVGKLFLSFSAASMYQASNTTLITMLAVMLVTLLVVLIATLILAKQTSADYRRVALGLRKMSQGRVDARIFSEKNDEAGQLFIAFNQLAAYLDRLLDSRRKESEIEADPIDIIDTLPANSPDTVDLTIETTE